MPPTPSQCSVHANKVAHEDICQASPPYLIRGGKIVFTVMTELDPGMNTVNVKTGHGIKLLKKQDYTDIGNI